jgi:4-aminobutyrate aminotransferase-like enzyme
MCHSAAHAVCLQPASLHHWCCATRVSVLEPTELAVLADLWMCRACTEVVLTSWRVGTGLEPPERSAAEIPLFAAQVHALHTLGPAARRALLTLPGGGYDQPTATGDGKASGAALSTPTLADRRERVIGPGSEPLSYANGNIVQIESARGCWVVDAHDGLFVSCSCAAAAAAATPASLALLLSPITLLRVEAVPLPTLPIPTPPHLSSSGRKLLDCYNNVPCVGHAHPRVSEAIATQARAANVNMRYLHPGAISLAERLLRTMRPADDDGFVRRCPLGHCLVLNGAVPGKQFPAVRQQGMCDECSSRGTTHRCPAQRCDYDVCPACIDQDTAKNSTDSSNKLDTVFFVNSGSEANDVAWRMAQAYTGNSGALCTNFAYHGSTLATVALSPETLTTAQTDCHAPVHVERWRPYDAYRGLHAGTTDFGRAVSALAAKGIKPAMSIFDGVLQSDGVLVADPAQVQALVRLTHEAGGLWCADEVQGGHGRVGSHLWSYQRLGILPDIVTLGKPMGNGHPMAAVVTSRAVANAFVAAQGVFFSTFGGNPVSCAAGHAVLDVLEDERVLARTAAAGAALRAALCAVTAPYACVGDVRGVGLANAIEFVANKWKNDTSPNAAAATACMVGLRARGVLVGTTGPEGNVVKIRPPLAFTTDEVPIFASALADTLLNMHGSGLMPKL